MGAGFVAALCKLGAVLCAGMFLWTGCRNPPASENAPASETSPASETKESTQPAESEASDPGIGPRARDGVIHFGLLGSPPQPAADGAIRLRVKFQNTSAGDWRFGQCKYVPLARYFSLEARGPGGVKAKPADGPPFLENQDVHPHKVLIVPPGGWQEMEVVLAPGRGGDDADAYVPGDVFPVLGKSPGDYRLTFTLHGGSRTPVGQGALDVRLGGR